MNTTMKVEIWSDVMCPFCYIGKRKFEAALAQFPDSANVELVWKSFQLDPDMVANGKQNTYQYLAERKGMSYEESVKLHDNVVQMASESGLEYNFGISVVANSFDAHRLLQLAKTHGLGDALEEELFRSYFTEGKDIADHATLTEIGTKAGLNEAEITRMLGSDAFSTEVQRDIHEARQIGVRGVPFFVFDRKYAISGAQQTDVFAETLSKSFSEWQKSNPTSDIGIIDGDVCTPDGECN
jgi:predicted DsbA family dithiol-disulfide isomerase